MKFSFFIKEKTNSRLKLLIEKNKDNILISKDGRISADRSSAVVKTRVHAQIMKLKDINI